jgi:S-adenosylmethionine-diacylglycerol 3-amino-3-carboxypropyl transferase
VLRKKEKMKKNNKKQQQVIEERASFDIIRYSNCWEDADVLLEALGRKEKGSYLSIASAGDNSFALLTKNPAQVIALDISHAQLACVELKKIAFSNLTHEKLLSFLGVRESNKRAATYKILRTNLSKDSKLFWDNYPQAIEKGFIHIGKFEGYFHMFKTNVLPLIHRNSTIDELLKIDNKKERLYFYNKKWNNLRWRLLFKIFFSRWVMGRLGRDPEFFKYVKEKVSESIYKRACYALTELPAYTNPYLEYILRGNFQKSLPYYLRPENYKLIKRNLDKLIIFKGNLKQAIDEYPDIKYDGFNLSDIFEYMSIDEYKQQLEDIIQVSNKGARLVYWNMLAERKRVDQLNGKIMFLDKEAERLHKKDLAFFYRSLIIAEVK